MAKDANNKFKDLYSTNKKFAESDIREARKWFRDNVKALMSGEQQIKGHMSDLRYRAKTDGVMIGKMFFYKYDPKLKLKLPYYDTFPLILVIDMYKDGWLGLNLHYIPPKQRAILLERLFVTLNNTKFDKSTKLRITYNILKSARKYRYFKPCLKRYLTGHIKSKMNLIRPQQWHKAILLPVARFKKAPISKVWSDSKIKWNS